MAGWFRNDTLNGRILNLAVPNIISNITIPLLSMVDLAILGHMESEVYIGAIALGGMIFNIVYWGFGFLRMGTSGLTAQAYGAENDKRSGLVFARAILVAWFSGIMILALQVPIEWLSFKLIKGSEEVESLAASYYYIRIFAAPATISIYAFTGWYLGMQNARYPMAIAIAVNVLNIGLNLLFVYGFGMRSDGVALGTLIAQYGGFLIAAALFWRKYRKYLQYWNLRDILMWEELKQYFTVNKDILIRTLLLLFAFTFFTSESARISDEILAVNTLLLQFLFIFSYFIDGYAHAAEALTGRYFGAGDKTGMTKVVRRMFTWGIFLSIPFSVAYLFAGESLLRILTDNPGLIRLSAPFLPWVALLPVVTFAAFIWDGVYAGATATAAMRNIMLACSLLIFLPTYYFAVGPMENHGLWLAMILFMAGRSVLMSVAAPGAVMRRL